jgi:predicted aspartyl protease
VRRILTISLLCCLLALAVVQGQQKQSRARQPSVDELIKAVRTGDVRALEQLRTLAGKGDAIAQFNLGVIYQDGNGVPKDAEVAAQWYRKAADQGYADAQYNLGWMYDAGEGMPRNAPLAAKWYRKAAEQGNADAQFSLASMYEDGKGLAKDENLAVHWYRKAAEQGDASAQKKLDRLTDSLDVELSESSEVALRKESGLFFVAVLINDKISLDFILDSGASDVSIPADVVLTLMRTGTITAADFRGTNTYVLADGSTIPSKTFRIKSLKVGNRVLANVSGSLSPVEGSLLLGQSFLSRFKSWSVDNLRQVLSLR